MRRWSLTTRLTVLYALVAASVLLGMAALISGLVDRHFVALDRDTLRDKIHLIQDIVAKAESEADLQSRLEDAVQHHQGLGVRVAQHSGAVLYASAALPFPSAVVSAPPAPDGALATWQDGARSYRALQAQAPSDAFPGPALQVWVAVDTVHHAHFIASLHRLLWVYAAAAALLSGVLGWWAARLGLAPLRAMQARAQAVTAHKLDERMPADQVPVEWAGLAQSLNDMLERLQTDFQRLQAFSSDLAHELRTPISNLLTQTQVALAHPRSASDYRDILASNAEEFQRLARMVSDMLLLARAEHGLLLPQPEAIALHDEVQALLEFYEALAEEKHISLQASGQGQLQGDRLMLRRAVSNLLSNALRYTPPGGSVTVALVQQGQQLQLHITNTGVEIAPADLPRLFDRFYRADAARSHPDSEGAGLGLAITKAIVQAHGGTVAVRSSEGSTCFSLLFVLRPTAKAPTPKTAP